MKWIKIGKRQNLIYPMLTIVFIFFRQIDSIAMNKIIGFDGSLIFPLVMFLSEFVFGLISYKSHINFESNDNNSKFNLKKLIQFPPTQTPRPDSNFKIYLLLFFISFFDFTSFAIETLYFPRYINTSKSLKMRLYGLEVIISAFLCYFLLKLKIYRHQIFSLISLFICLIIIIIFEYYFNKYKKGIDEKYYGQILILFTIENVLNSFLVVTEKYLLDYDNINAFQILIYEGLFGIILTLIFSSFENFKGKNDINGAKNYILLFIFIFLYFILSGGRNIYKIITNKLYSPMTKTLTDYITNPIFIFYYYIFDDDFKSGKENEKSSYYFLINILLSIITVLCGCIYNEFFILYCFNLEYNTYYEISKRAKKIEKKEEQLLPLEENVSFSNEYVFNFQQK